MKTTKAKRVYNRKYYARNAEVIKAKTRAWQTANPEKYKARKRVWEKANCGYSAQRWRKRQLAVQWYLQSHPCVDCGETNIDVLDFDHVRGEKLFNVKANRGGRKAVWVEIQKCEIVCANCHRIRTKKRKQGASAYSPSQYNSR